MAKGVVIQSSKVKPFVCDSSYSSKMLLDDSVAGTQAINVNEGTLKAGGKTAGSTHTENEIYYVVKGQALLHLDEETVEIGPGNLVFIPAGVFHSLDNQSATEDFVLITLWERASSNEVWHTRLSAWGKTFKTIDED